MYSVDSANAARESIGPFDKLRASSSARKERGLQDDKAGKDGVSKGAVWRWCKIARLSPQHGGLSWADHD